jgi:thiamine-phosphate pyrophosphorylase
VRALGPLLVLTDRRQSEAAGRALATTVAMTVEAGARAVVLREKDLDRPARYALAGECAAGLRAVDGALVVASDLELARSVGAEGLHLAEVDPWPTEDERAGLTIGASCHDASDVLAARGRGAAYVTLSPVFATASKPGYGPALGPQALGGHQLPVYALGGVAPDAVRPCLRAGAAGVAVMGGVMGAADPGEVVVSLLAEASAGTVVLIHGGLGGEIDAAGFWHVPGVADDLATAGWRVLSPDRLRDATSWVAEGDHLAVALAREPDGLTVVAGSNGCSAAVRLALDHTAAVGRLVLCWPSTSDDGSTMRGVRDDELRALAVPVTIVPAEPENAAHTRASVDRLVASVPRARLVDGTVESPRPEFATDRSRFAAILEEVLTS